MKKTIMNNIVSYIAAIYLWLCLLTCRINFKAEGVDIKNHHSLNMQQGHFILFWHNRLIICCLLKALATKKKIFTIVSNHGDGQIIANVVEFFGNKTIRGSSNRKQGEDGKTAKDRGGMKALLNAVREVKKGNHVIITPDGPRGPIYEMKPNAIKLAIKQQIPLLALTATYSRYKQFNSWDKFMIPYPFCTIDIFIKKIDVNYNSDLEENILLVEKNLDLMK